MRVNIKRLKDRCQQSIESLLHQQGFAYDPKGEYSFRETLGSKILIVAHCDHVDCGSDHFAIDSENDTVFSTRLDDRLGVYAILDYLPSIGIEGYDVLLTNYEEKGQSTARNFRTNKQYNWIVSFDRRGTDVVVYDYIDDQWLSALGEHWMIGQGSFSDISMLEHLGACAANIGIGYHHEHTMGSCVYIEEFLKQMEAFRNFWDRHAHTAFPWSPRESEREGWRAWYADETGMDAVDLVGVAKEVISLYYPHLEPHIYAHEYRPSVLIGSDSYGFYEIADNEDEIWDILDQFEKDLRSLIK